MARTITNDEWDAATEWYALELIPDFDAFQIAFMTRAEKRHYLGPWPKEAELNDEAEAKLFAEDDAWREARKVKTLALAERLGCSVYLAVYLLHLNDKLDRRADAVRSGKLVIHEPPARKKRKRVS